MVREPESTAFAPIAATTTFATAAAMVGAVAFPPAAVVVECR
jgi:hypothetical protein